MTDRFSKLVEFGVGVIKQITGENVQMEASSGEILQESGTRILQHFGLITKAPSGVESAYATGHGETASIAEGIGPGAPDDVSTGQSVLYDSSGNVVGLRTSDGVVIYAKEGKVSISSRTDNVELTTEAGDITMVSTGGGIRLENKADNLELVPTAGQVRIGKGTMRKAARDTDKVSPTFEMALWLTAVGIATGVSAPSSFGGIDDGSSDTFIGD